MRGEKDEQNTFMGRMCHHKCRKVDPRRSVNALRTKPGGCH